MTRNAYVLVGDSAYIDTCIFAAKRLRASGAAEDIVIYSDAVRDDDTEDNIFFQTLSVKLDNLPLTKRLGEYTYWRIPSIAHASEHYSRVAYLDSDFYAIGRDVDTLFDLDLRGRTIGATHDFFEWLRPWLRPKEFRVSGISATRYFNAGLILVDCQKWLKSHFSEKCLRFADEFPEAICRSDQSLLNAALVGEWTEISPVWNWQFTSKAHAQLDLERVKFLHLCGTDKPWRDPNQKLPLCVTSDWKVFDSTRDLVDGVRVTNARPRLDAKSLITRFECLASSAVSPRIQ